MDLTKCRFWFTWSGIGPEILHFNKLTGDAPASGPWTTLSRRALKVEASDFQLSFKGTNPSHKKPHTEPQRMKQTTLT